MNSPPRFRGTVAGLVLAICSAGSLAVLPVAPAAARWSGTPPTVADDENAPGPSMTTADVADATVPQSEPTPTSGSTDATVVDNEFIPENANIGDCVSALPRPECGSEERGGWRQSLVLLALVAGIGVIGWRMVAAMRRPSTTETSRPDGTAR